ncbi:MAG: TIGR03618 family F420-dependent PPOX class oxidoreductase [Dehalococcoidia bacterium]
MPLTQQEIDQFLRSPNIAIMATVRPDGQPHAVPTWYDYQNGEIVLHMGLRSRRYRNLRRNDRVTLCMDTRTPPYKAVVIQGRAVTEVGTDDDCSRRMALAYLGKEVGTRYADAIRGSRMVIARVKPEKVISWDYGRGDNP